tara:strand:+ start:555 stop:881 length:327 start_codon:yes stop_codon:yes gene_type:complete
MGTSKNKLHKKIYWVLIILSIVIDYIFYSVIEDQFSLFFLVCFSGIPFLLFATGCFGLLWPKIKPEGDDEVYISHSLIIGFLFIIMFFIHVWIILPSICPEFGALLGV